MASRGWGQSKNCALLNEKAGNTMTKIRVSKDTLYGARVGLPKKKNIVQLPEESVHFPPSEAIVTTEPCWVSPRVAYQPQAAVITMASFSAVRHEKAAGRHSTANHSPPEPSSQQARLIGTQQCNHLEAIHSGDCMQVGETLNGNSFPAKQD